MLVILALSFIGALAVVPAASAAPPAASFTYSPPAPLTLETVTFTSSATGDITSLRWELDGDGLFDDGNGLSASRSFPKAGRYMVRLYVTGPDGNSGQDQWVTVANRAPTASLTFLPPAPVAGETVNFVSTSSDPDGSVASQLWDLDGDGRFDDAAGGLVSRAFAPGAHTVRLRVVDSDGAEAIAAQTVPVAAPAARFLNPFPVIRMFGRTTRTGVRITRLTVQAPAGSRVEVRCRGRGCPRRSQVRNSGVLRFRRFERRLRAPAVVEIFVTNPTTIGKYTRYSVRRRKPPRRRDLCIPPGTRVPTRCPTTGA